MSERAAVVIAAAGAGRRMGDVRKQYLELAGEPVLARAIRPFLGDDAVVAVVVALPADDAAGPPAWLTGLDPRIRVVAGGAERGDSVRLALAAVPEAVDVVLVHDAARPLIRPDAIRAAIRVAAGGVGAVVAVPVADTIKEVDGAGVIVGTPDRARLWQAQTPQAFPRAMLVEAYEKGAAEGVVATDDAALVERYGGRVVVVPGHPSNLKITTAADLDLAATLLRDGA